MKSAPRSLLSSMAKRRRNWVRPVLLILLRPALFKIALYQPLTGVLPKVPTFVAAAAVLKSPGCRLTALPNLLMRMSANKLFSTLKGLLPTGAPLCLISSSTEEMMAPSGRPAVLKDSSVRYWRFGAAAASWEGGAGGVILTPAAPGVAGLWHPPP